MILRQQIISARQNAGKSIYNSSLQNTASADIEFLSDSKLRRTVQKKVTQIQILIHFCWVFRIIQESFNMD